MTPLIGNISLNISMVLYLINYIPQIIYNGTQQKISGLSFYFHYLLLLSSLFDLIYGLGAHLPWQYCLVSILYIVYLFIQHVQIKKVLPDPYFYYGVYLILTIACGGFIALFFFKQDRTLFIIFGYASQVTGWMCCFPQIIKNMGTLSALSLSIFYLLLDLFSNICDNISAWTLSWPMPSKLGAIFSTMICFMLIYQRIIAHRNNIQCSANALATQLHDY